MALFTSFVLRKWRYQIGDVFGGYWKRLEKSNPWLYRMGNQITTRRASAEYFFKMIPAQADEIEFLFPPSTNVDALKAQINDWLNSSTMYNASMLLWGLVLPSNFLIAKFFILPANIAFSYNVFRFNSSWRARNGSAHLASLLKDQKVSWIEAKELQHIGSSIDDCEVIKLGRDLKLHELIRTHTRTKWESRIFGQVSRRA